MTHVVTDNCIKCKYTDCVEVCPVDCFFEHDSMLAINPQECIDCGVCIPECPAEAIKADTDNTLLAATKWVKINSIISEQGHRITRKKSPLPDADEYNGLPDKLSKFLPELDQG